MGYRPGRGRANNKARRENLSFEARFRILCFTVAGCILGLSAAVLLLEHFSWATIAVLLAVISLALLLGFSIYLEQSVRPLQTLANVVAALREEDYSFRARGASRDHSLGELAAEINALANTLQAQRLGALEAVALLRRVIAEMDAPVLTFDEKDALRLLNPAAERVLGLRAERDLGRGAEELALTKLLAQEDETVLQLDKGGNGRWMVRRGTFRQRGLPHKLIVLSDVSAALREEEQQAWRRLIRVLGHEISNSLAPIKSIAGSLRSRAAKGIDEQLPMDLERGLGVIEGRAESLHRFVQAYRQLAQLPRPALRNIGMRTLLDRVVSLETRLAVQVESAADVELAADADQLEQMLINLVRNGVEAALDYQESGAAEIAPRVTIRFAEMGEWFSLVIEDNGPGVANPANLFVPFYTTKRYGTGVGLALARQIAEGHGGTIELRDRSDTHGCQAEVRLPRVGLSAQQQRTL